MDTDCLPLDDAVVRTLSGVTTATLTTVLLKKGLRNVGCVDPERCVPDKDALSGARSRCDSFL